VLDCDDPAHGKAAAVAGTIDLVDNRRIHVAATQEIRVQ
jgi:hypothetical protein